MLVIGLGVGLKHAHAYQSHSKAHLKSISDFDIKKIESAKAKFSNIDIFSSSNFIIDDQDVDVISVASYDNYHCDHIIRSINNGKHVMAEKPLCLFPGELEKIIKAKNDNPNIKISSNLVLRTNSRFLKLKNDIKNGKFGEIFYLEGDYYWGRKEKLYGWRSEMDFYSIIHGAAIHMIDLAMWLLNDKPSKVQVAANNISTKGSNLNFNSFAVVILEFSDGKIVKLTGNGGCIHPHFHGLKIFGNKLTAVHNLNEAYYIDSCERTAPILKINEPYPEKNKRENLIHSFIDNILDEQCEPIVKEEDVFDVMSVCFSAEEAMKREKK